MKKFNCKKCGGPVQWRKLPNGKFHPENLDGGDHWDTCSENLMTGKYGIKKTYAPVKPRKSLTKPRSNYFYNGDRPPWEYPTYIECIGK